MLNAVAARLFFLFSALLPLAALAQQPLRLIAHRGGIVDCHHPENSWGAANAAIRRGYWMLEIDLQETSDGHIVVHHDDLQRSFGVLKMPGNLTWDQIRRLRASEDHSHPLEFSEFAALCKGRVQLMIDTKPPHHSNAFYESMEQTLRQNGLLQGAWFIGTPEARAWFKGKARISISEAELKRKVGAGEEVAPYYFLFEHGTTLDRAGIALGRQEDIPVVVSINADHYKGRDEMMAVHADIERMREFGVTDFQIDSDYALWLR